MIDVTEQTQASAFDNLDFEIGTDLSEDPWLGAIVVESKSPNKFKPGRQNWVLAIRPINEETPNIGKSGARWLYIEPNPKSNKFSYFLKQIRTVFPETKTMKPGLGQLIGLVAYWQEQERGQGQYGYKVTVPLKRANTDEALLAQALPPLDLSASAPTPSGVVPSAFEWTTGRVDQAVAVLAENKTGRVNKLAMDLEDTDLRNQILAGQAADYLTANGALAEGDDGVLHRID